MRTSRRRSVHGFTLIELMITVAIIGVCAAVAIPSFINYLNSSRSSEAYSVLVGIREAQVAYHTDVKTYADMPWMPYVPPGDPADTDICAETHPWEPANANFPAWQNIFVPGGPTYHTYRSFSHNATGDRTPPSTPGTSWPTTTTGAAMVTDWFVASAWGNVDCNETPVVFWISSHSKEAFKAADDGEY